MLPDLLIDARDVSRISRRGIARGVVCSFALHLLFCVMFFYFVIRPAEAPQQSLARFLPVDLVPFAEKAASPAQTRKVAVAHAVPARPAREIPTSPHRPVALSPVHQRAPEDPLEIRLKQFAKLRQPDSTIPHTENGASDDAASVNAPAGDAGSFTSKWQKTVP